MVSSRRGSDRPGSSFGRRLTPVLPCLAERGSSGTSCAGGRALDPGQSQHLPSGPPRAVTRASPAEVATQGGGAAPSHKVPTNVSPSETSSSAYVAVIDTGRKPSRVDASPRARRRG